MRDGHSIIHLGIRQWPAGLGSMMFPARVWCGLVSLVPHKEGDWEAYLSGRRLGWRICGSQSSTTSPSRQFFQTDLTSNVI